MIGLPCVSTDKLNGPSFVAYEEEDGDFSISDIGTCNFSIPGPYMEEACAKSKDNIGILSGEQ